MARTTKNSVLMIAGKRVRPFTNLQELCNHLNAGKPVIVKTNFGPIVGAILTKQPGTNCVVSGSYVIGSYILNGGYYSYNIALSYVGYESASTKDELAQDKEELEVELALVESKLAYLAETKQEEFDETEFKVWNTLQVLSQKKTTDLEKAKAIAALIKA